MGAHHEISGEKIILIPLHQEDLNALLALYQDPEFLDDFGYIEGIEQTESHLLAWYKELEYKEEEQVYSIIEKESSEWIGFVTLMDINPIEQDGWLVIGLKEEWRNQGYGKQTLRMLIEAAFTRLNLRTLKLSVLGHNQRAISLYEQLGFEVEMIFPKFQCPNLFGVDIIQLQLMKKNWKLLSHDEEKGGGE